MPPCLLMHAQVTAQTQYPELSSDTGSAGEHACQQADSSAFVARVVVAEGQAETTLF